MIEEQRSIHQEDRYFLRIKTDQDQGNFNTAQL